MPLDDTLLATVPSRLYSGVISDTLDALGNFDHAMATRIRPLDDTVVLFGRARTGLYAAVYDVAPGASVSARLELANGGDATPLASAPVTIEAVPGGDLRIAYGTIPIATLPPGDFLLRAVVSVNDKPVGELTRVLRKVRR